MSYACYNGILQSYKMATQKAVIYITARNRSTFISIFNYIQTIFISIPPLKFHALNTNAFLSLLRYFVPLLLQREPSQHTSFHYFFQILHSAYLINSIIQKISAHCQTYPTSPPLKTCISYIIN